jgi:hypothetical protein
MYRRYYRRGREGEVEGKKQDVLHRVTYPRYTQIEVKKKEKALGIMTTCSTYIFNVEGDSTKGNKN